MKEVILSADDKLKIYSVPDIVADNLDKYCFDFCENWIWKNPNGAKLLKDYDGMKCACYDASDFIEYLNDWLFPEQKSRLIQELDYYDYDYELPQEYKRYPSFNF